MDLGRFDLLLSRFTRKDDDFPRASFSVVTIAAIIGDSLSITSVCHHVRTWLGPNDGTTVKIKRAFVDGAGTFIVQPALSYLLPRGVKPTVQYVTLDAVKFCRRSMMTLVHRTQ